jgi:electron transport complex protein RnfB
MAAGASHNRQETMIADHARREFIIRLGRIITAMFFAGAVWRIFFTSSKNSEFEQPARRFGWQINPEKCRYCGACGTACVRQPAAVKAVNDQKKCSNCVVCYGHISNRTIPSAMIEKSGLRVCPNDAVIRKNFSGGLDGSFLYNVDHSRCIGCAKCVKECNVLGTRSMFLVIRPDLCLGCNSCACARACPYGAIEQVPVGMADDYSGEYLPAEGRG